MESPERTSAAGSIRLPRLTKIAAWWLVTAGAIGVMGSMIYPIVLATQGHSDAQEWGQITFFVFSIFWGIICPIFIAVTAAGAVLFSKRKRNWVISVVIISVIVLGIITGFSACGMFNGYVCMPAILLIIPLTMLAIDAKNYWAMLEKAKVYPIEPAEQ
jgi:hypothetical protein